MLLLVQDHAEAKVVAADQLRNFTTRLRHAILTNQDVAAVWTPAARVLDIRATLDSKVGHMGSHTSTSLPEVKHTLFLALYLRKVLIPYHG